MSEWLAIAGSGVRCWLGAHGLPHPGGSMEVGNDVPAEYGVAAAWNA